MRFGISTQLYARQRLQRAHLLEIAAHGFDAIELVAEREHFDYQDPTTVSALGGWLRDAGLELHSIHAPTASGLAGELSNASSDAAAREQAVEAAEAALRIAEHVRTNFFVVHVGARQGADGRASESRRDACRSLEAVYRRAAPLGVRLALEVIPNHLSEAASLTRLLEDEVDLPEAGICLDFGHAFLMGDILDTIETASGHVLTTHVHDNHGRHDEHLVPFAGEIDWGGVTMATQKIGYDGVWLMELSDTGSPRAVLEAGRGACRRLERLLDPWPDSGAMMDPHRAIDFDAHGGS